MQVHHLSSLHPPVSPSSTAASSSSSASATTMQSIFEDFFNIDLMNAAAGGGANNSNNNNNSANHNINNSPNNTNADASSSRSSSHSPSGFHFPLTPLQQHSLPVSVDDDSIFNMHLNDDFLKLDPLAGYSSSTFDFFGGIDPLASSGHNSMSTSPSMASGSTSAAAGHSSSYQYAIDPQLVGTPASSSTHPKSTASLSEIDEDEEDEEEDDVVLPPVKVGGKGKGRKGTLQSGGIVKRSSAVRDTSREPKDSDSIIDNWRPSPEEYAKMSSKEKRQLRNKISARNFRVRRKEYIVTLEGDIAERDRLIEAIRNELGTTKSENNALRQEVATLKKAILEGRASPMLPPPAPLSPVSPLSTLAPTPTPSSSNASASASTISPSSLVTPNTRKDLPTSPRLAALGSNAFWGGSSGGASAFGGFGGITPVHTALIPEFGVSPIVAKVAAGVGAGGHGQASSSSDNINPSLNGDSSSQQQQQQQQQARQPQLFMTSGFDAFQDNNMFTLKALDEYRMQLWGRMALQHHQREMLARQKQMAHQQQQQYQQQQQQQLTPPRSPLQGLASNLRPHYFKPTSASSVGFSALLPGKGFGVAGASHGGLSSLPGAKGYGGHGHGLPTPPASPPQSHASFSGSSSSSSSGSNSHHSQHHNQQQHPTPTPTPQHAMLAALASQTLLGKMSSAFWDAFSGSSSSSSSSGGLKGMRAGQVPTQAWDAEKVRKVLEGTAVLRVVDVDAPVVGGASAASSGANVGVSGLEDSLRGLSLASNESSTPKSPRMAGSSASSSQVQVQVTVKQQQQQEEKSSSCESSSSSSSSSSKCSLFGKCTIRAPASVVASVGMKK